jgi:hypothetical protein
METQAVLNMYRARGFNITRVEGDQELVYITNVILQIQPSPMTTYTKWNGQSERSRSARDAQYRDYLSEGSRKP